MSQLSIRAITVPVRARLDLSGLLARPDRAVARARQAERLTARGEWARGHASAGAGDPLLAATLLLRSLR